MKTIKLFIVDDSAVVRQTFSKLVEGDPQIELLGVAADPIFAMNKFKAYGLPDVLISDIEMPRMDGITFLKKMMQEHPIPVIICSAVAGEGSQKAIEALHSGAVEVIGKPKLGTKRFLENAKAELIDSIKAASKAKVGKIVSKAIRTKEDTISSVDDVVASKTVASSGIGARVIAIGSSTGGVQVLENILSSLPSRTVPILITQHMPAGFTASLAKRLDQLCNIRVKEAQTGDKLEPSTAYIAPGDKHMLIKRNGLHYSIVTKDGPKVSRHRPSVDVLFRSVANEAGKSAVGFILTGMGEDGARGMKEMFDKGGKTYAQDEQSCIVYGMPKEAVKRGGVFKSLDIRSIIEAIINVR
ncbi:MAG: chemotaxis response regulator protein-glutamate methylesterase [Sulfurimonas sp.]|nr:chemotaxis response regulator protein-glutamate methylesterase [Sulfurimonas sp.]